MQGFSLLAAVRRDADDNRALEQLCRTSTCPAQDRRVRAVRWGRVCDAEVADTLARQHHALGDVAAGVHGAIGCAGCAPAPACP